MIRCPKCGQTRAHTVAKRVCWKCKKQIGRHHKWRIVNSRIEHRDCKNPTHYEKQ